MVFRQFFKAPSFFIVNVVARSNRDSTHSVLPVLVRPNVFEEFVADPLRISKSQMLLVLVEQQPLVVNKDDLSAVSLLQCFDTRQSALKFRVYLLPTVCYYGDVGVYDISCHLEAPIRRLSEALLMAVISPISSPKKLSGQFSISPHSFSRRSLNSAAPLFVCTK